MTDFKQYLLDEFVEDYQEGSISRREALKLIAGITGSVALASSLLAACTPPAQPAATALPTEPAAPTAAPTSVPTTPPTTVLAHDGGNGRNRGRANRATHWRDRSAGCAI
jgi:carboxymethylenebutenolidase